MVQTADESDNKTLPQPEPDQNPPAAESRRLMSIWLAIAILVLALVGAGYWLTHYLQGQLEALARTQAEQQQLIGALEQEGKSLVQQLELAQLELKKTSAERDQAWRDFAERINTQMSEQSYRLAQLSSSSRARFLLEEAGFLLRQANQRLQLEKSIEQPARLLTLADSLLAQAGTEMGEPAGLLAVRKQLAQDLQTLQATETIDYTGIYFQIDALMGQMDDLALAAAPRQFEGEPNVKKWQREADNLWEAITFAWRRFAEELTAFIRVRRYDKPVEPLMPPEHEANLRANIKNQLQVAQWALLRNNTALFETSLTRAQDWLVSYFPLSPQRDRLAETLAQIKGQKITLQLPDISASAQVLSAYQQSLHLQQEVQP